jgi:predicted unusual protein kinase regulating ubiquinone biosynthesis (AarF/ABC1/UbiB family)
VVKVLHTGIDGSVQADLATLKTMLVAGRILRRPKEEIDAIFEEIGERLQEELDYRQEAQNLLEFRRYFAGDPEISIPMVHEGWSTGRVLTMERLAGRPLPVFAASAPESAKQRAGMALARAFLKMQYLHRAIHADPHPGNYLFLPDGRLGILDFGCVKRFDLRWMAEYGGCGLTTRYGQKEACMQHAIQIQALAFRDPASEDALWDLCRAIGKPFRGGEFVFGGPDDGVQEEVAGILPRVVGASALRSPRELVFLHRALTGVHQILKVLKTRGDWGNEFEPRALACRAEAARLGLDPAPKNA